MWIVKAWPKTRRGHMPKDPQYSWHSTKKDAQANARVQRSRRVYSKVVVEREQEVQGPTYYCCCPICGAVVGETRPDQQPEPWQELQRQRVDHINDTHRVYPDYPYPDFER